MPLSMVDEDQAEDQEEFESLESTFASEDLYGNWFDETERSQRSAAGNTPELVFPTTAPTAVAPAVTPKADTIVTQEQLGRMAEMDLSGIGGDVLGLGDKDMVGMLGGLQREEQYNNVTAYNPLGTAIEDAVVYEDLNSPEAIAAKEAREAELSESLQGWAAPLKELATSDPDKFLADYSALSLTGQLAFLRNEFDNGDMTEREYQDAFAEQWNSSDNAGTLQWVDKYGYRLYAPDTVKQQGGQDSDGPMTWYETEGLFDGPIDRLDQYTPRVEETFNVTSVGRGLLASAPLRLAAGVMTGGLSEGFIAAGKGLTGDTLHAGDWLSIGTAGLQVSGMIAPPVDAAAAAEAGSAAMQAADAAGLSNAAAMAAGNAAQAAALAGKGLGTLSYAQTSGLMRAAASGDLKGAVLTYFGPDLIDRGLETVGLDPTMVSQLGISDREFKTGLSTAAAALAEGGSLDDALKSGFINYIQEGGSFGSWTDNISPDIDFGVVGDAVSWLADKIQTGASALGDLVNPLDDRLDDVTPDTVKDIVSSAGRDFEDWLKDTATGMLTGAAGAALLGGGDNGFTMPTFSPSSTGTTDKLFGDKELFKFKNRIELSEFKDIEAGTPVSIEEFLTSPFESDFAQTQERFI